MNKKRIIVSVTNDIVTDQRISRLCSTLFSDGFDIIVTGRLLPGSLPGTDLPYKTRRVKHWFNKKMFFYAEYNIRLFIWLIFTRFDILHSNDLDTLPANYLASIIKRKPLVYDSHEYFTEVPELDGRPGVKRTWEIIEKLIFPKLRHVITVNDSIAGIYKRKYNKDITVIRNLPEKINLKELKAGYRFGLPEDKKLIILQGSGINRDRGAHEAVDAMDHIENAVLVIAGSGDALPALKESVAKRNMQDKVIFIPPMPYFRLMQLTAICDCGLSLDKDTSMNYRYSLPNKIFDYIMAGIPVLASSLPEVRNIVEKYKTGIIAESHNPVLIAEKLRILLFERPKEEWKESLLAASIELNWEREKLKLLAFYKKFK